MSWLSDLAHGPEKILGTAVSAVENGGNAQGTPTTRKYGYDPTDVTNAVVADLTGTGSISPVDVMQANPTGQLIILGIAGLGMLLLFSHKKQVA